MGWDTVQELHVDPAKIRFLQHTGFINRMKRLHEVHLTPKFLEKIIEVSGSLLSVETSISDISRYLDCIVTKTWKWDAAKVGELAGLKSPPVCKRIATNLKSKRLVVTWKAADGVLTTYSKDEKAASEGFEIIKQMLSSPTHEISSRFSLEDKSSTGKTQHHASTSNHSTDDVDKECVIEDVPIGSIIYLQQSGFLREIEYKLQLPSIKTNLRSKTISVVGCKAWGAKKAIKQKITSLHKAASKESIPKPLIGILLHLTELKKELMDHMRKEGLVAPWEVSGDDRITVCSDTLLHAQRGLELIQSHLCSFEESLNDELPFAQISQIIDTFNSECRPWSRAVPIKLENECLLRNTTKPIKKIRIHCQGSRQADALAKIRMLLKKNTVQQVCEASLAKLKARFLTEHCPAELETHFINGACEIKDSSVPTEQILLMRAPTTAELQVLSKMVEDTLDTIKVEDIFIGDDVLFDYISRDRTILKTISSGIVVDRSPDPVKRRRIDPSCGNSRKTDQGSWNLKNVSLKVLSDDITDVKVDAIVNSIGRSLDLTQGTIGPAILQRAGHRLPGLLRGSSQLSRNIRCTPGLALCQYIYHCILDQFMASDSNMSKKKALARIVLDILEDASKKGLKSVAIPLIGTGNLNLPLPVVSAALIKAFIKFVKTTKPGNSLVEIQVVILPSQQDRYQKFIDLLETTKSQSSMREDPNWNTPQLFAAPGSTANKLTVCYRDRKYYTEFRDKLEELCGNKIATAVWSDAYPELVSLLPLLGKTELDVMDETANSHSIQMKTIKFQDEVRDVALRGVDQSVKNVQRIFLEMVVKLPRPKQPENIPTTWTPPLGVYREPQLDLISTEYAQVQESLNRSLGRTAFISWIKRIQNPHQHKQFFAEQEKVAAQLKSTCDKVTKDLVWHGTSYDNINKICKNNFNRSLAGTSTGAMYGRGSYFSTSASYSDGYCHSDAFGWKHIIRAKIVVGRYAQGSSGMITPPIVRGEDMSYNSTVDNILAPSIFVTYTDPSAYPEYVISYR